MTTTLATPHGIAIPPLTPGSPAWLRTMSASKIAAVVGLSPYESRFSLWHRMAGLLGEQDQKAQLARGHYLEPGIRAWFCDQHPDWQISTTGSWRHPDEPLFTAAPDGEIVLPNGEVRGLEVKTAANDDEWGQPGSADVPAGYTCQAQWQMLVRGTRVTHFAVLSAYLTLTEYVVPYDADDAAYLVERARSFMDSLPGGPAEQRPDLDSHGATYEAVRKLHPDIADRKVEISADTALRYLLAIDAEKTATVECKAAKAALLDEMGDAKHALFNDLPIARRQPSKGGVALYSVKDKT